MSEDEHAGGGMKSLSITQDAEHFVHTECAKACDIPVDYSRYFALADADDPEFCCYLCGETFDLTSSP